MAGSASTESQPFHNLVTLNQPLGIPASPLMPYHINAPPLSQVSYANLIDLPMAPLPLTYGLSYPVNPLIGQGLIKREAEPDTSYTYKSKVDNPADGTKYEFDVQVDRNGHGQSHQQIELQRTVGSAMDNYLMEQNLKDHRRMEQMTREQNAMDQRRMEQMIRQQNMMNQMMQRDSMTNQRMRSQMIRDQDKMDSRMYSEMGRMELMNQRNQNNMRQRNKNMRQRNENMRQTSRMDMMSEHNRMLAKREAKPSFEYAVAAGHPAEYHIKTMYNNDKGMMNQRMIYSGMQMMDSNMLNQRENTLSRHSQRMMKRGADASVAYAISVGHPTEQSRQMTKPITYLMPYVDYSFVRTMVQGHPDGGVSYQGPSLTMPYPMTPINMITGSRVVVQKEGQGYAVHTMV